MNCLLRAVTPLLILMILASTNAQSVGSGLVFSAKKYSSNLQTGITRGLGEVKIKFGLQEMEGDEVEMKSTSGAISGRGHIKFVSGNVTILADEVEFDVNTGLGQFKRAIMRRGNELYVEAQQLSRVGEFLYHAKDVKVSSCLDCPQAWSVTGSFAEVEVEGYAEIHHALFQVKDSPILYFPIFVIPIKTKRQSGFLAPKLFNKNSDLGFRFRLPYYWAARDDLDSTWNYEFATRGGHRLNSEFRYQYSDRSYVGGNASYGRNFNIATVPNDRFGYSLSERYQINSQWTQRMRGELGSDTRYSSHYDDEFSGNLSTFLINEPSVSYQTDRSYAFALLRFHRDNVVRSEGSVPGLDSLPELEFYRPFEKIWGPFFAELEGHFVSLRRKGPTVDTDSGWIREGDRLGMQGRIFMGSNFLSFLNYSPEIFSRVDAYRFPDQINNDIPNAYRAKFNFSQKISSEIFRVYTLPDNSELKAVKHSVVPRIGWSYSPPEIKSQAHPFFENPTGPRFDLFDPGSPDAQQITLGTVTEEQRLQKHHLLTLGLDTRVVGRFGVDQRRYEEFFVGKIDQDIDLADYGGQDRDLSERLSPLRISTLAQYGGLVWTMNIAINFAENANSDVVTGLSYAWSRYQVKVSESSTVNAKSAAAAFTITNYGPWSIGANGVYDLLGNKTVSQAYELTYASPSKCWYFKFQMTKLLNQEDPGKFNIIPEIAPIFGAAIKGKFL